MIIDLSVRLRQLRLDKRLRQDQVARLVGVSKGAISAYETDIRQPSYDVLIRLANLYRCCRKGWGYHCYIRRNHA